MVIGTTSESMHEVDRAMIAYENALRHNPYNVVALTQIASLLRAKEQHGKVTSPSLQITWLSLGGGIFYKSFEYWC